MQTAASDVFEPILTSFTCVNPRVIYFQSVDTLFSFYFVTKKQKLKYMNDALHIWKYLIVFIYLLADSTVVKEYILVHKARLSWLIWRSSGTVVCILGILGTA